MSRIYFVFLLKKKKLFSRKFNQHNCFHSAPRHETYPFLNPLLDYEILQKDLNNTYDDNYNTDYPYETLDNDDHTTSTTMSYSEEQNTGSVDDSEIHYDASSTVTANFLTNSMTTEHFYTRSSSQSETMTTILESNTMKGILFLCLLYFTCLINNYLDLLYNNYIMLFDLSNCLKVSIFLNIGDVH